MCTAGFLVASMSWLDTARASLLVLAPLAFSSSVYSPGVFSMQPSHYSCSSAAELAAQCLRQHLVVHRCLANPYPRTTCRCRCCSRLFSSADSQGCSTTGRQRPPSPPPPDVRSRATFPCSARRLKLRFIRGSMEQSMAGRRAWPDGGLGRVRFKLPR